MKYNNINILSPIGLMKYYIEYTTDIKSRDSIINDSCYLSTATGNKVTRFEQVVDKKDDDVHTKTQFYCGRNFFGYINAEQSFILHKNYKKSYINIYFPEFSVDTYVKDVGYAVSVSIWIHGKKIDLGSYLIKRQNIIATDSIKTFVNNKYYEYCTIEIPNPWELIYSDDWKAFRQDICGEPVYGGTNELNNTGAIINVSLHPVKKTNNSNSSEIYKEIDGFEGGQNSLNLTESSNDYLSFNIEENSKSSVGDNMIIKTYPKFNRSYSTNGGQGLEDFKQYIHETYMVNDFKMILEIYLQDKENVYRYTAININSPWNEISMFDLKDINDNIMFMFNDWNDYKDGMYIQINLNFCDVESDEYLFYINSNTINITKELFKYLIKDSCDVKLINLNDVDMEVKEINTVNKVEKQVINIERPTDYKSNIIKPVFFKAYSLNNLVLHSEVTEQVCINLDRYKSKVDSFILKIGSVNINEYGRSAAGIIFKINAGALYSEPNSGIFYILNEDNELVTSGNYIFER